MILLQHTYSTPDVEFKKIILFSFDFFAFSMILSLIFIWICISESRESRIFCNRSLPVVMKHKSPFRKAGTGLSVIWQGKANRTGDDCVYSGVAFLYSYKNSGCENPFWVFTATSVSCFSFFRFSDDIVSAFMRYMFFIPALFEYKPSGIQHSCRMEIMVGLHRLFFSDGFMRWKSHVDFEFSPI